MQPRAVLTRLMDGEDKETLGELIFWNGLERIFECKTLELEDKGNANRISRIPQGSYWCAPRYSERHSFHFHVLDVEGRTLILIHAGNRYTNTEGCILVGEYFSHVDDDGILDVGNSRNTLARMTQLFPEGFRIYIVDMDK